MDFDTGIENVEKAVPQELWSKVTLQVMDLVRETREVVIEKDRLQEFSRSISELGTILKALDARKVEASVGSDFTRVALETLHSQLKKARKITKAFKSRSRLHHSMLLEVQGLAKDIAETLSSFQLVNLDMAISLKSSTEQIIRSLSSMELHSAVATEAIASETQKSNFKNSENQDNAIKLLEKIANAVGATANVSLVQNESTLLKQQKEEMENQKKQVETLQLAQLPQLFYSTELVTRPENVDIGTHHQQCPINSFVCSLCNNIMTDPVTIQCGHSFEKQAIQDHFRKGAKNCPTCQEELPTLDLTPNLNLRSSIEEWKQRDMDLKFQSAISAIKSDDLCRQNMALNDIHLMMEMHQYAAKISEEGLIPTLVGFLKDNRLNSTTVLKCLLLLAKHCNRQKQALVEAGVVRCIVEQMYKGKKDPVALALLLELSEVEAYRERIGTETKCIPLLVSLMGNSNPDISQKAQKILQNLSYNTSFVVKIAEAGHFQPFVARFNRGPQESMASMAADLLKMHVKEDNLKHLEDKNFVHNLVQLLSSSAPAYKLICVRCIRKLSAYPKMVKQFLSEPFTIPLLLGLISFVGSDSHLKEEAGGIMALLLGACQHSDFQGLCELQSENNINLFLQLVFSSNPSTKIQFLHVLVELGCRSKRTRNLVQSNSNAVIHLFFLLETNEPSVTIWVMKLVYCIYEDHPDGVQLPPSPKKETAVNAFVSIFTSSPDAEQRSVAAAIISKLPKDDIIVDETLKKSKVLQAIHEVICSSEEHNWIIAPAVADTALLENALAALLRFTEPTKPELQRQVGDLEMYPSLVRVLSRGSSLAKKRTAIALAQLSQSTSLSLMSDMTTDAKEAAGTSTTPLLHIINLIPKLHWCCSISAESGYRCPVHGSACSERQTFCLVKTDALKPLVRALNETESGLVESALTALESLLIDHKTLSHSTVAIVECQGVEAILQVLEKGSLSTKTKALDLLQKILEHTKITDPKCERILIQLLNENTLKKKAAMVLKLMKVIPEQSSYF